MTPVAMGAVPMTAVTVAGTEAVPLALERPARTLRRWRGRRLVDIDDVGDLPTLRSLDHVTDDHRAFERILAAHVAQRGDVQQHIPRSCLARIVRNDETVAFSGIKPLNATADPHRVVVWLSLPINLFRHPPLEFARHRFSSGRGHHYNIVLAM